MTKTISRYIDTEQRLKIRLEKLLISLKSADFVGTVHVINGEDSFEIVVANKKIYSNKSFNLLANLPSGALFKLYSKIEEGYETRLKGCDYMEFLFKIVENLSRRSIIAALKPYAADFFSIKPEAAKLTFIAAELKQFVGKKKIEIFSNLKRNYRIIYFLFLSRYANIIPAPEAERAKIEEKFEKFDVFGEESDKIEEEAASEAANSRFSKDKELADFLDLNERFEDLFQLFEIGEDFNEKILHKKYIKIVQKTHPDRLQGVSPVTAERAKNFLKLATECYELLKNREEREKALKLTRKYGPIRCMADFTRMKEYDEAMFRGSALLRLGSFESAAKIFDSIYRQTKNPEALEKKTLAIWDNVRRLPKSLKEEKFLEIKKDLLEISALKLPEQELLFILAEIYEYFDDVRDAIRVLDLILERSPDNFRAVAMKKKFLYYDKLKRKEAKNP